MKTAFFSLLLGILCFNTYTALAQTQAEPTRYTVYSYMKVASGMDDDYLKLEKAWKKIHAAKKKAGKLDDWSLTTVMMPSGANVEYNYVTRNAFVGDAQLAEFFEGNYMPDNWASLLTTEEIILVNRTGDIRTMVKSEVWATVEDTFAEDIGKAKIAVFNYFDFPEGKTGGDHIKIERDIWKPIHDARVKDGTMKGWVLLELRMPFGDDMPYQHATVDLYTNMSEYLAPWFDKYFAKVHPGKNMDQLMQQTDDNANLLRGEVRMILDRLAW